MAATAPKMSAIGLEPRMAAAPVDSGGLLPVVVGPEPDEVRDRVALVMVVLWAEFEMVPETELELAAVVRVDDEVMVLEALEVELALVELGVGVEETE
jgi:hypothetical protein